MKNKKGMDMVISMTTKIIIGLVVLVIASSIFFIGPNALLVKAKSLMPSFSKYLPDTGTNDFDYESRPEQEQVEIAFKELYGAFEALRLDKEDTCFYYFDSKKMNKIFNKFDIEFTENTMGESIPLTDSNGVVLKDNDGVVKTNNPGFGTTMVLRRALTDLEDSQKGRSETTFFRMPNIKPCLVYGNGLVSNFYKIWLTDKKSYEESLKDSPNLHDYKYFDHYMLSDNAVYSNKQELGEFDTEDNGAYVLYKADKNHICLFPTKAGDLFGNCDGDDESLDDDCFDDGADDSLYVKAKEHHYYVYDGSKCTKI